VFFFVVFSWIDYSVCCAGDLDRDLVVVVVEWEEDEEDLPRFYSDGWKSSLDPK